RPVPPAPGTMALAAERNLAISDFDEARAVSAMPVFGAETALSDPVLSFAMASCFCCCADIVLPMWRFTQQTQGSGSGPAIRFATADRARPVRAAFQAAGRRRPRPACRNPWAHLRGQGNASPGTAAGAPIQSRA